MPGWKDLRRFCEHDGWECYRKTDHDFYRKTEPDGTIRRTKVSRSSGEIPRHLWKHILTKQLQISQEEFNKKL